MKTFTGIDLSTGSSKLARRYRAPEELHQHGRTMRMDRGLVCTI